MSRGEHLKKYPMAYPWKEWIKAARSPATSPVALEKGRDFLCQIPSMAIQIRNAAHRHGLRASVSIRDNIILFRVKPKKKSNA
jgi:hypothetical protein